MGRLFDDMDDLWAGIPLRDEEDDACVLVAVMNDPRALTIARSEGWYRVPLRRAPPRVGADYLAFYQTAAFGPEERWHINYYAPIRRYRIVRRRDLLPDEADHPRADDEYYKIEIGSLESLPHPIPSRRLRRITFIPTTLKRLLSADEINDLWLGGKIEEQLWKSFKEQGISVERRVGLAEEDDTYCVDFALYCQNGRIAILFEGSDFGDLHLAKESSAVTDYELAAAGWRVLRLGPALSANWAGEILSDVWQMVEQLGGLALYTPDV